MVSFEIFWRRQNVFGTVLLSVLFASHVCSSESGRSPYVRAENETLPYRNPSLLVEDRVEDLLQRMTLPEKAGQLFQAQLMMGPNGTFDPGTPLINSNSTERMLGEKLMTHFNLLLIGGIEDVRTNVEWYNRVQERALQTRLGIPVTLSTDPRHGFTDNVAASAQSKEFSKWPESLGLAALRDPDLVQKFADIARQEYIAIGIRSALHPQVDLATEPRWARIYGTMGEDADLTSQLVVSYLKGFQGEELGPNSVSTVTKHFPGGGPMQNGEDSHFTYGKNQTYPGNNFEYHLRPFKAAIAAGARQIMPYYSRPIGTQYEEVGFSFNKGIVTDLLRGELRFEGIVVSDWGLVTDGELLGEPFPARAWGVESLSELERCARILEAGVDQFGGEERTELIIELVETGVVTEQRLDVSVRRLLREKFVLGLFDNPFVSVENALETVGKTEFRQLGNETQRKAYTLLTNKDNILPLKVSSNLKFYVEGINSSYLTARNLDVVEKKEEADLALLRLQAPYDANRTRGFEAYFHAGSLAFNSSEQARQSAIYTALPTIVDIYLDRPAVIPEIAEKAAALFASFGSSPDAFLDVVFGADGVAPLGKLPFDMPRSMKAVEESLEDVPFDTKNPVFKYGHGLSYEKEN